MHGLRVSSLVMLICWMILIFYHLIIIEVGLVHNCKADDMHSTSAGLHIVYKNCTHAHLLLGAKYLLLSPA